MLPKMRELTFNEHDYLYIILFCPFNILFTIKHFNAWNGIINMDQTILEFGQMVLNDIILIKDPLYELIVQVSTSL